MLTTPNVIRSMFFHCGWAIPADKSMEAEHIDNAETLRIHDENREICVGSMTFTPFPGKPFDVESLLSQFPPPEMEGVRFRLQEGDLYGSAAQVQAADEEEGEVCWVLFSILIDKPTNTILRCTISVREAKHREWAVQVWRNTFYYGRDEKRLQAMLKSRNMVVV